MFMEKDVRWKQRFANFERALTALRDFITVENLNVREEQGLSKSFEYTYELGCNTMRDYLIDRGFTSIIGSKDAIRQAFNTGLISEGEEWMNMYKDRNKTVHTYDTQNAEEVVNNILHKHYPVFEQFYKKMKTFYNT